MIRDPSDGTVRPEPKDEVGIPATKPENPIKPIYADPNYLDGWYRVVPDTGLRQPTRTDAQERLEESRKWLKQYRKAIDDANRMNDKGEVPK